MPSPCSARTEAECTPTSLSSRVTRTPFRCERPVSPFVDGQVLHRRDFETCPEFTSITSQWINSIQEAVQGMRHRSTFSWRDETVLPLSASLCTSRKERQRLSSDPRTRPAIPIWPFRSCWHRLKGIEKGYELREPVEEEYLRDVEEERNERGIESLPGNLLEAIQLQRRVIGEGSIGRPYLRKIHCEQKD